MHVINLMVRVYTMHVINLTLYSVWHHTRSFYKVDLVCQLIFFLLTMIIGFAVDSS